MYASNLKPRQALSLSEVQVRAPSAFAVEPHAAKVSERYEFIPTTAVIELLNKEGWAPVAAAQSKVRGADGKDFAKHLITFQNKSVAQIGDSVPELVLTNSHNGSAAFNIMAGLFRLICSNGLVVCDANFGSHKIKHVGYKAEQVLEASYKIISDVPRLADSMNAMRDVSLTKDEQVAFAKSALTLKYDDGKSPIAAEQLLLVRRAEDRKSDLWTTFNTVQENLVRGGLRGYTVNAQGRHRRATTRGVQAVGENVKMNRALWTLAEEMRKIKVG